MARWWKKKKNNQGNFLVFVYVIGCKIVSFNLCCHHSCCFRHWLYHSKEVATPFSVENILAVFSAIPYCYWTNREALSTKREQTPWKIFFGSDWGREAVEGRANYARRLLMAWLCASSCTEARGRAEGGDAEQGRLTDASRHILPCAQKQARLCRTWSTDTAVTLS